MGKLRQACFTEGTQVVVGYDEQGAAITRNIEDLLEGDWVLAKDENNPDGEPVLKQVTKVWIKTVTQLRVLTLTNEDGDEQVIQTTDEHPFFAEGRGWIGAGELAAGDRVLTAEGVSIVAVTSVVQHPQGITVYNLEVEGSHTFFVDDVAGGVDAAWVHNANYYTNLVNILKAKGSPYIPTYRSSMTWRRVSDANGNPIIVIGQAGGASSTTTGHGKAMYDLIKRQATKHDYAYFTLQRSVRTATGGLTRRGGIPDVVGIRMDGTVDVWEVMSKTDSSKLLNARIALARFSIPAANRGVGYVIDVFGNHVR